MLYVQVEKETNLLQDFQICNIKIEKSTIAKQLEKEYTLVIKPGQKIINNISSLIAELKKNFPHPYYYSQ